MGGRLCTEVTNLALLGHAKGLSDRAVITAYAMASIARDEPTKTMDARVYYGGWEMLAKALGFPAYTESAKKAVQRAIRELIAARWIEPLTIPRPGQRQAYWLPFRDPFAAPPNSSTDCG